MSRAPKPSPKPPNKFMGQKAPVRPIYLNSNSQKENVNELGDHVQRKIALKKHIYAQRRYKQQREINLLLSENKEVEEQKVVCGSENYHRIVPITENKCNICGCTADLESHIMYNEKLTICNTCRIDIQLCQSNKINDVNEITENIKSYSSKIFQVSKIELIGWIAVTGFAGYTIYIICEICSLGGL